MRKPTLLIAGGRKNGVPRVNPADFQVEEVSYMSALTRAMADRLPNVLLLSLDLPDLGGTAGIRQLRRLSPQTRIVALSDVMDECEELEVLRIEVRVSPGVDEQDRRGAPRVVVLTDQQLPCPCGGAPVQLLPPRAPRRRRRVGRARGAPSAAPPAPRRRSAYRSTCIAPRLPCYPPRCSGA